MDLPCTRCRTVIPTIAKFCPACGAGQEPQAAVAMVTAAPAAVVAPAAPKPTGPQACPGCGMLRGSQRKGCDVCTTSYEQPGAPIPPTGDALWVGVRCQFQCRLCGHPSPLNHLDVDGSVSCLRCGLDQVFDVGSWIEGLDHAMRCGVLAGQREKYKQLGVTATSLELVQSGIQIANGNMIMRSLRVLAGPGHPPCSRCHGPLEVEFDGLTTKTRCPQCSATQSCELPANARDLCSAIRGVIAEELTLGKRDAKVDDAAAGATAINCAHCAAPLKVTGVSTIVTCEYCGASSRIPRRTMFKLGHDQPVTQLWWIAFSRQGAAALTAPQQPRPARPARPDRPSSPAQPRPDQPTTTEPAAMRAPIPVEKPAAKPDGLGVLAALGVVILVGVLGYRGDLARWATAVRSMPSARGGSAGSASTKIDSPPSVTAEKPAPPGTLVEVSGCRCGTTQLRAQIIGNAARTSVRLRADRDGRAPVELDTFDLSSDALGLGLVCNNDRIVIAGGSRAAAWSLDRGTKLWDRALPAPFRAGDRTLQCSGLKLTAARIAIPTGPSGTTTVKLTNGQ